jgi:hypothetical protein
MARPPRRLPAVRVTELDQVGIRRRDALAASDIARLLAGGGHCVSTLPKSPALILDDDVHALTGRLSDYCADEFGARSIGAAEKIQSE